MKRFPLVMTVMFLSVLFFGTLAYGQDAKALTLQGIEQCNAGKFGLAIATFDKALKKKPNDPNLLCLRGRAYTAKGQYDRALADLNQAIKLNPRLGQAYFSRGMVYVYQEKYDEAVEEVKKAASHGYKDADFLKYVQKMAKRKKKKYK